MAVPRRAQVRSWLEETAARTADAARRALRSRAPERTVQTGASGSPTSALDRVAERVIIRELRNAPIPLNLCSEEIGNVERGAEWWLVADPVDGTRNALHGVPFHAVSLAIGRRDLSGVELGLVHSIPTPGDYWAEKGRGATFNGRRLRVRRGGRMEPLVGTALDYERGLRIPKGERLHFRDLGSAALEMCLVASGGLDAFLCDQPMLRIVDIAASTLIVREAGGHVLDLAKKPLNVPFDVRAKFPMVALGDARLWRALRP
jgi:fructose-1,6-bisphosphatase/inositol monophosphatase family enzyme